MTTKITEVEVRNVMRIGYARVTPEGHTTLIGGNNAQGKSSFLNAICMAIGGKKLCPAEPIRQGENSAEVVLRLTDDESHLLPKCVVKRMFYKVPGGKIESTLEIVSDDEYQQPFPPARVLYTTYAPSTFSHFRSR